MPSEQIISGDRSFMTGPRSRFAHHPTLLFKTVRATLSSMRLGVHRVLLGLAVSLLAGCGTPQPYVSVETGPRAQVRITKDTSYRDLEVLVFDAQEICALRLKGTVDLKGGVLSQTVFVPAGRVAFFMLSSPSFFRGSPIHYQQGIAFTLDDTKEYSIEFEASPTPQVKVLQYPSIPVTLESTSCKSDKKNPATQKEFNQTAPSPLQ
jgi:hypothetical protein